MKDYSQLQINASTSHMTSFGCKMVQTFCSKNERFKFETYRRNLQLKDVGSKMLEVQITDFNVQHYANTMQIARPSFKMVQTSCQ